MAKIRPAMSRRAMEHPIQRSFPSLPWSVVLLTAALLIGGGSTRGTFADAILTAISITAIPFLLFLHASGARPMGKGIAAIVLLIGGLALLALLQTVPVGGPWSGSELHRLAADIRQAAGLEGGHRPLSLDPSASFRYALGLALPLVLALAIAGASAVERKQALVAIAAVAAISTLLALLQTLLTDQEWLVPYEPFDRAKGGLFNNRNHHGVFQSVGLLAAAALYRMRRIYELNPSDLPVRQGYRQKRKWPRRWWLYLYMAWAALGVFLSWSGASVVLLLPSLGLALLITHLHKPGRLLRKVKPTIYVAIGVVGVLGLVASLSLIQELFSDRMEDGMAMRFSNLPALLRLVQESFPWGTGFGAFVPTYRTVESLDTLQAGFLNHAHNEPLHFLIEGGLPGIVVLIVGFFLIGRALARRLPKQPERQRTAAIALGGALLVLMLHSLVDYPLRTATLAASFSTLIAIIAIRPPPVVEAEWPLRRQVALLVPAIAIGMAGSWFAFRPMYAQSLVDQNRFSNALQFDPGHPQALAQRSWQVAQTRPSSGRDIARRAISNGALQPRAIRTILFVESYGQDLDREGWSLAGRLGWRDSMVQTILALDALGQGNSKVAADHVAASLKRRALVSEAADVVQLSLTDEQFRERLITRIGPPRGLYEPLLSLEREEDTAQLLAVEAFVTSLASRHELPPNYATPLLRRLIATGQARKAVQLYRKLYPVRSDSQDGPAPRFRSEGRTPFDFPASRTGPIRMWAESSNRRLSILGDANASEQVASRHLPVGPEALAIRFDYEIMLGRPILEVILRCDNTIVAREVSKGKAGQLRLNIPISQACWAPQIEIWLRNSAGPFRIELTQLPDQD